MLRLFEARPFAKLRRNSVLLGFTRSASRDTTAMWSWFSQSSDKDADHQADADSASSSLPVSTSVAASSPARTPKVSASSSTARPSTTLGLTPSASAAAGVASAPPVEGAFWGFTGECHSASDPALDDMMQFFGFAHFEQASDYVGCVSFELSYPDGGVAIRTVEVVPKPVESTPRVTLVEVEEKDDDEAPKPAQPSARFVHHAPNTAGPLARMRRWLPAPTCTLHVPRLCATAEAAAGSVEPSEAEPAALSELDSPLPSLPFSSRIRIYHGPVPPDVKPTARLICPRSVFFDVYQGKLDPMTSVLTGKARCPGWRYVELMHFGQSFEMHPQKWIDFYAKQEEVASAKKEDDEKRRRIGGGSSRGGGSNSGGSGGMPLLPSAASSSAASAGSASSATATSAVRASPSSLMPRFSSPLPLPQSSLHSTWLSLRARALDTLDSPAFASPFVGLPFLTSSSFALASVPRVAAVAVSPSAALEVSAWRQRASDALAALHAHAVHTMHH